MAKSRLSRFLNDFSENHPVASSALTFGAAGAAGAAALSLIREIHTALEERRKMRELEEDKISPDTIVLRVPRARKAAECADPEVCRALESDHDRVVSVQSEVSKEMPVKSHETAGLQRDLHGKFTDAGEKIASTGAVNRTWQVLAGIGGATAGFLAVKKLYERMEQKRLKRQIEAAQQEYLDLIGGSANSKYAEVNRAFLMDDPVYGADAPAEKSAGIINTIWNIPRDSKNLTAAALASYIMMALGTGYVTKKVLESKFDQDDKEEEPQKVNRILFKTSEAGDTIEIGAAEALATIDVFADAMAHSAEDMPKSAEDYGFLDKVTSTPDGKQWLLEAYAGSRGKGGKAPDDIPGLSFLDKLSYAKTLSGVRADPEAHAPAMRSHVMGLIRKDPKGWFSVIGSEKNKGLVSDMASDALAKGLSDGEFGWFAGLPGIRHLIGGVGSAYLNTAPGRRMAMRRIGRKAGLSDEVTEKAFSKAAMTLPDISAVLSRSAIISDKRNTDLDKKLDEILERMPQARRRRRKVEHETEVRAGKGDADAEEFVLEHGDQIARILNGMKEKELVA